MEDARSDKNALAARANERACTRRDLLDEAVVGPIEVAQARIRGRNLGGHDRRKGADSWGTPVANIKTFWNRGARIEKNKVVRRGARQQKRHRRQAAQSRKI